MACFVPCYGGIKDPGGDGLITPSIVASVEGLDGSNFGTQDRKIGVKA